MAKDPTKEKKALTQEDVDQQDSKTRLWQSLEQSYGRQREQSNEAYDKAISQADRQALSRGMQRSSYNNATLANLQNQKVKAANDITSAQIAAYQSGLAQQEEAEAARAFQTSEREASQEFTAAQNALAREFQTAERLGTQEYQSGENALNRAFSTSEREAQQAYQSGENALAREFQAQQNLQNQQWQSGENALNRQQSQSQFDTQLGYQKERNVIEDAFRQQQLDMQQKQWEAQQAQWREEFDYSKMTNDQKIAFEVISAAAGNGQNVSDDILQRAGITMEDFNSMKKQTSGGGPGKIPEWKQMGFTSASDPAYLAYLLAKNRQTSDSDVEQEAQSIWERKPF